MIQIMMLVVVAAAAMALLADRLLCLDLDWPLIVRGLAWALGALIIGWLMLWPVSLQYAARMVDRAAGLKNLVSSGLDVMCQKDEASEVVRSRASEALARQSPLRAMPLRLTRSGRLLPIALTCLAGVVWFVPAMDLLGRRERVEQARQDKAGVQDAFLKLTARLSSMDDKAILSQDIQSNAPLREFTALATNLMGLSKQEALLKLGEFESKYKEDFAGQREFEQAGKSLNLNLDLNLGDMPQDIRRPLEDLVKGLNQGDMKKAAQALRDMSGQLKSGKLSPDDRKALAHELSKTIEKMQDKGARPGDALSKMLKDIEASPEDLEALLKKCDMAARDMDELADFCENCDSMSAMKEGLKDAKKAMLGDSFKDFDPKAVEAMMEQEAAMGRLGMGEGAGQCEGSGNGNGTGGQGRGRGGNPLENASDTAFVNKMSPGHMQQGKILHQLFISGVPDKGEALTEYSDVLKSARQEAASSLARDRIPREYEGMIKTYFDSLEPGSTKEEGNPNASPIKQ